MNQVDWKEAFKSRLREITPTTVWTRRRIDFTFNLKTKVFPSFDCFICITESNKVFRIGLDGSVSLVCTRNRPGSDHWMHSDGRMYASLAGETVCLNSGVKTEVVRKKYIPAWPGTPWKMEGGKVISPSGEVRSIPSEEREYVDYIFRDIPLTRNYGTALVGPWRIHSVNSRTIWFDDMRTSQVFNLWFDYSLWVQCGLMFEHRVYLLIYRGGQCWLHWSK